VDEVKEENKKEESSKSGMYAVFLIVLVLVAGGSFYIGRKSGEAKIMAVVNSMPKPSGMAVAGPSGPPSMKGQKFLDTSFYNQAVQIYPGTISESAKAVMSGWNLKTTNLADGSVQADLIPVGSEATEGDTMHSFVVEPGDKLYFVDLNPNDDKPGMDANTHDDLGILVDANGIIQ
jgi:hypothetical protein